MLPSSYSEPDSEGWWCMWTWMWRARLAVARLVPLEEGSRPVQRRYTTIRDTFELNVCHIARRNAITTR